MKKQLPSILPPVYKKELFQVRVSSALLDKMRKLKSANGYTWEQIVEACFNEVLLQASPRKSK